MEFYWFEQAGWRNGALGRSGVELTRCGTILGAINRVRSGASRVAGLVFGRNASLRAVWIATVAREGRVPGWVQAVQGGWSWCLGQVKGQVKVESVGCQPARPCLNNRRR